MIQRRALKEIARQGANVYASRSHSKRTVKFNVALVAEYDWGKVNVSEKGHV